MRKIIVIAGMVLFLGITLCFAQETYTITTYYPSPYGVYRTLRLYPSSRPAGACQDGEMYYDNGAGGTYPAGIYSCVGGTWQSSGAGGFWAASPVNPNNIYNTNTGNVGIGTTNPQHNLHLVHSYGESGGGASIAVQNDLGGSSWIYFYQGSDLKAGVGWDGDALKFYENAGYRMAIKNGNVGIGTLDPGVKLDVAGRARMTEFQLGTAATANHVLTANSSGVGTWQAPTGGGGVTWSIRTETCSDSGTLNAGCQVSCQSGYVRTGCGSYGCCSLDTQRMRAGGAWPTGGNTCQCSIWSGTGVAVKIDCYAICVKYQ